ncbi:iron-containing alcohol dehydrogenase [Ruegeria hyattellae]|uniref:iron-containing alcohol dehydrogenase n=1 Tax=Ruegeria hyattellae TaxID=3233337 RepID=UPI00355B6EAD
MPTISYLTRIEFDYGAVSKVADLAKEIGMKSPFIVTDRALVELGMHRKVTDQFGEDLAVFEETPSNPTEASILAATAEYKRAGCDGIIAIGGGSPLDLAKGVRLLTGHELPLAQYAAVEGGVAKIHGNICPMIAIPTTSGTGSEVGRASVVIMEDGRKLGVLSPHLLPSIAVCDPELTLGLPPILTAATGMDALSHCLETYMGVANNAPADAIAIDGLMKCVGALETAVKDGSDRQARWDMMMAALEGAMAFQKGLGAVHSLSHPLGAIKELNLHHGTLNAILMPAVLRFNKPVIGEKWNTFAQVFARDDVDQAVEELSQAIGLPSRLRYLGVTEAMLPGVAESAMKDHCHLTNPRTASAEEYLEILKEAW